MLVAPIEITEEEKCNRCGKKATQKDTDPFFDELPELLDEGSENEEDW